MFAPALIEHSARLLKIMMRSPKTSESLASEYFRSKKYIGSRDRKLLSSLVFGVMRALPLLEKIAVYAATSSTFSLSKAIGESSGVQEETRPAAHFYQLVPILLLVNRDISIVAGSDLVLPRHADDEHHSERDFLVSLLSEASKTESDLIEVWVQAVYKFAQNYVNFCQNAITTIKSTDEPDFEELSGLTALPEWVFSVLHRRGILSAEELLLLGQSMLEPAPLTLRVNTRQTSRNEVLELLESQNITAHKGRVSPSAIIVEERMRIVDTPLYQNGYVEIQDEASQLVGFALNPSPHWTIADTCAGAGGKCLHIADLQGDSGSITACDIEPKRLQEIPHRAGRASVRSIRTSLLKRSDSDKLPFPLKTKEYDAAIIDAPCSGSGTFRRQPALKWKITPRALEKHAAKQRTLLLRYADCVKPGGVLIYSTCSIFAEENEEVVRFFLETMPDFVPAPLLPAFRVYGFSPAGLGEKDSCLTLYPHRYGTDGFFIARMKRLR